jgi:hypothetical protein
MTDLLPANFAERLVEFEGAHRQVVLIFEPCQLGLQRGKTCAFGDDIVGLGHAAE